MFALQNNPAYIVGRPTSEGATDMSQCHTLMRDIERMSKVNDDTIGTIEKVPCPSCGKAVHPDGFNLHNRRCRGGAIKKTCLRCNKVFSGQGYASHARTCK
jgi:hypothetical protein